MTVEQNRTSVQESEDLSNIIKIDEAKMSSHLGDLVHRTVEETLNDMLDTEAQ
jgi:putative transposase